MRKSLFPLVVIILAGCNQENSPASQPVDHRTSIHVEMPKKVGDIKLPEGYTRISTAPNSFTFWLRNLAFKTDKTVYLFNGEKKRNQSAQFAVIDMSRSKTDLQQCADVVMRLRAEYLFANKKYDSIRFMDFNRKWYNWPGGTDRVKFDNYLQHVFGWCGSASLEKQLRSVENISEIQPGDVLIKGGFPGHAVIVADMAINKKGEKIFMLIQGYQPAQDIHLLVNPTDPVLSPWYKIPAGEDIFTPEWTFTRHQLARW
jgi:hypothetical protein